jgi:hypothetical protein
MLLGLAGCVTLDNEARVDSVIVDDLLEQAATQVKRCYRAPRVPTRAKQIITRLELKLNEDGTLAALPAVVAQDGVTPDNSSYAPRMAEAASLAVIRCAPLKLPPEHAGLWSNIELKFSPRMRV